MNDRDYRTDCRLASSQNECNQTQRHREHRGNFTLDKMEAGEQTGEARVDFVKKKTEIESLTLTSIFC